MVLTMKKMLCALLLPALLFVGAAAAKEKEINIAMWKLPLNLPAIAAFEEDVYEKAFEGVRKVNYLRLPSGPRLIQALGAGQLDIGEGLGAAVVLSGAAAGADLRIIGVCSRSPRGFAIVVRDPGIREISDLKGRKVAGVKGSVVHQLYFELMAEAGLAQESAEFFPTTLPAAVSALLAGRVDAALLAGTEIVRAEKGGARVLADGEGHLSGLSLIVTRSKFLEENPEAVKRYLMARRTILAEMKKDAGKYIAMTAKETGTELNEARKILSWYDFDDQISATDILELNTTMDYLKQAKIIEQPINMAGLIYRVNTK